MKTTKTEIDKDGQRLAKRLAKKQKLALKQAARTTMDTSSLRTLTMLCALTDNKEITLDTRKKAIDMLSDARSVPAVLKSVGRDRATWKTKIDKAYVSVEIGAPYGSYTAANQKEFLDWSLFAASVLRKFGRDPNCLNIPGRLSLSMAGKVVFGWFEDESHPDAMALIIGEVMDQ